MAYKSTSTGSVKTDGFSFRPQLPGESDGEYKHLRGKAQSRYTSRKGSGRGGAIKGMLKGKLNC